jgi:hypothetical protein
MTHWKGKGDKEKNYERCSYEIMTYKKMIISVIMKHLNSLKKTL